LEDDLAFIINAKRGTFSQQKFYNTLNYKVSINISNFCQTFADDLWYVETA